MFARNGVYRAQVDALLHGELAMSTHPEGLAHDLVWTESGVQHAWGLGVPLWLAPFQAMWSVVGREFPDRIALALWLALTVVVVLRGLLPAARWWHAMPLLLMTVLLPGFVAMVRGRLGVYEEAAIYAYCGCLMMLGGLASCIRAPSAGKYLALCALAGAAGLIRPTVWCYGVATGIVGGVVVWTGTAPRRRAATIAGLCVFAALAGVQIVANKSRFGAATEFGYRLTIHSLPGNIVATRFGYPFQDAGIGEAAVELVGSLFGRPEIARAKTFYGRQLHVGQSERVRWREYYFSTYSWPYLPLILCGVVIAARAWRPRRKDAASDDVGQGGTTRLARWLGVWAVAAIAPLVAFYVRAPSVSSRYQLDFAPGFVALLLIAWFALLQWAAAQRRERVAIIAICLLWIVAVGTSRVRKRIAGDPVNAHTALQTTRSITDAPAESRQFPASYVLGDRDWIANQASERPHGLYLNGIGWDQATGRVPPATHFFVNDPQFIELELAPAGATPPEDLSRTVQVAIGLDHLVLVSSQRLGETVRARFALPRPRHGLQVVFVAFGPADHLDRPVSDHILRSIRWRE